MARGKLLSFSGIDGSGKSTQVTAVAEALVARRVDVVTSKTSLSATYSIFALSARLFGDPHAYHPEIPATLREFVIACDVARHSSQWIEPLLSAGGTVVWDRGPLCYEAYARAYGADETWVLPMLRIAREPDLTFFLDVDPDLAWKRIVARQEKPVQTNEQLPVLRAAREEYLRLVPDRPDVVMLDGERPAADLTAEIIEELDRRSFI